MKNKKGFTLIEMLAVVVILGIMVMIATLGVSNYIDSSKRKMYIHTAKEYIKIASDMIAKNDLIARDPETVYYFHVNNLETDSGKVMQSPYGNWIEAYVIVVIDEEKNFTYYWTSVDEKGMKVDITEESKLSTSSIYYTEDKSVYLGYPIGGRYIVKYKDEEGDIENKRTYYKVDSEVADECYSYKLTGSGDNRTATITYYNSSCGKDVIIPDMIDNYVVTEIYSYAFNNMGLTTVKIPDTVTKIGSRAFAYNNLTKVVLPTTLVTIDSEAFMKNKLPEVDFSSSTVLKTIGARAFRYNNITGFSLPNSVSSLGACAFCDNPIPNPSFLYVTTNGVTDYSRIRGYIGDLSEFSDKTFVIPSEVNGVKLTTIESSAFHSMGLSGWTVVIPDTVTTIGSNAFSASGIAAVNLPSGLQKIGDSAFYNNKIANIEIPDSVTSIGTLAFNLNSTTDPEQMWIYKRTASGIDYSTLIGYSGANKKNIVIPESKNGVALKTIASSCFRYLSLTGTVKIPNSVTSIGQLAFALNKLTSVDNGDGDTTGPFVYKRKADGSIDKTSLLSYAGYQTNNVIIPSQVTRLENYAFYYSYIKGVVIPEGVTYIGSNAFNLCKLSKVVIPSTVTSIGSNAFKKQITWTSNNGALTKIVNKTGRSFNWKSITDGPSDATFVTGTIENWYGDIEVTDTE